MSMTRRMGGWLVLVALLAPVAAAGQPQEKPPLKPEEIEALVAPIALYPDSVLSQVLMASTYPLEIVQAARWVQANPKVTGDAAVDAAVIREFCAARGVTPAQVMAEMQAHRRTVQPQD